MSPTLRAFLASLVLALLAAAVMIRRDWPFVAGLAPLTAATLVLLWALGRPKLTQAPDDGDGQADRS